MDNTAATAASVASFLERYRRVAGPEGQEGDQDLRAIDFDRLRPAFREAELRLDDIVRLEAPHFNIFRVIRTEHKELMHSRFLANLLDPWGGHGQGALFLHTFLELCERKNRRSWYSSGGAIIFKSPVWVSTESTIFDGRCDIMVHAQGLCLVIENKIRAGESEQQLQRYYTWLHENERAQNKILVFLTVRGSKSRDPQMTGKEYIPISYSEDICGWLLECLSKVQAPHLRSTLNQYLDTLERFKRYDDRTQR